MIEELKLVLDTVGDLSGFAAWVVGGFLIYKLVVYMTTTGSIVYILKLSIERIYAAVTKPRQEEIKLGDVCLTKADEIKLKSIISKAVKLRCKPLKYVSDDFVDWLEEAINEKLKKDNKNG